MWDGIVIIIESDDRRCGLLVDDLLGQQQVVVKGLGGHFSKLRGISGASIMSDGLVGLILDAAGIMDLAQIHTTTKSTRGVNGSTELRGKAPLSLEAELVAPHQE